MSPPIRAWPTAKSTNAPPGVAADAVETARANGKAAARMRGRTKLRTRLTMEMLTIDVDGEGKRRLVRLAWSGFGGPRTAQAATRGRRRVCNTQHWAGDCHRAWQSRTRRCVFDPSVTDRPLRAGAATPSIAAYVPFVILAIKTSRRLY